MGSRSYGYLDSLDLQISLQTHSWNAEKGVLSAVFVLVHSGNSMLLTLHDPFMPVIILKRADYLVDIFLIKLCSRKKIWRRNEKKNLLWISIESTLNSIQTDLLVYSLKCTKLGWLFMDTLTKWSSHFLGNPWISKDNPKNYLVFPALFGRFLMKGQLDDIYREKIKGIQIVGFLQIIYLIKINQVNAFISRDFLEKGSMDLWFSCEFLWINS